MKRWWILTLPLFLALKPSDSLLTDTNFLYPYLNPSIPPHLSNPISLRILSHTLDSLSVIQRCVFFKCLCAVDFELWMPKAPSRDLRRTAVWSPIYHISPAATKRQTPSIQHCVGFAAHITSIDPINSPLKPSASQIAVRLSLCVEKRHYTLKKKKSEV